MYINVKNPYILFFWMLEKGLNTNICQLATYHHQLLWARFQPLPLAGRIPPLVRDQTAPAVKIQFLLYSFSFHFTHYIYNFIHSVTHCVSSNMLLPMLFTWMQWSRPKFIKLLYDVLISRTYSLNISLYLAIIIIIIIRYLLYPIYMTTSYKDDKHVWHGKQKIKPWR